MGKAHICYILRLSDTPLLKSEEAETEYQTNIKPILTYLYANPSFSLSISMSGLMLEWFDKVHPEFKNVIEELMSRKQIEMIGGGYYNPLFPLLSPVDRVAQIELFTTQLRKLTGKRPRGMYIVGSSWDPSLINGINTAGMDYLLLDSTVTNTGRPGQSAQYCPFVVEDAGKTLTILPMNQTLIPGPQTKVESYVSRVKKIALSNDTPLICCMMSPEQLRELIEAGWFAAFLKEVSSYSVIEFSKPSQYLKNAESFSHCFIPAGSILPHLSARDFVCQNREIESLYARMIYVSNEISLYRGDKVRKKAARDELLKAQHFQSYWPEELSATQTLNLRKQMYRHLLCAESIIAETAKEGDFLSSSFDYDMDGYDEFIFRFPYYSAFISTLGGTLFELDILHCSAQYTLPASASGDFMARKLFTDLLVYEDTFTNLYQYGTMLSDTIFAQNRYKVQSFNRSKHEIVLKATGQYITGQETSILKKYTLSESGVKVQYIVKNESDKPLDALFAVESNLALPEPDEERTLEAISGDKREIACLDQMFIRQQNVSYFQVSDKNTETTFTFEPNEDASLCLVPLKADDVYISTCTTFYWKLSIQPGYEIEKTLFLNIRSPGINALSKKKRKKK
ncbi:MAG: DUF1926 domain-containing protein [Treponema sp.]|nr:DUF1926 domain-containing protein [Candidatus Treponema caballi]